MKHIEPEKSHEELNILRAYVGHETFTEQCDLGIIFVPAFCFLQLRLLSLNLALLKLLFKLLQEGHFETMFIVEILRY